MTCEKMAEAAWQLLSHMWNHSLWASRVQDIRDRREACDMQKTEINEPMAVCHKNYLK